MLFYRIFPAIAAGCAALMDIQRAKAGTDTDSGDFIHIQNVGSRRH